MTRTRRTKGLGIIADFVRVSRRELKLNRVEFAKRAGVAVDFVRRLEQGQTNVSVSRVNTVLAFFGHELIPKRIATQQNDEEHGTPTLDLFPSET